jgi:conjugative relaxase-like TrwC/TraI family protein
LKGAGSGRYYTEQLPSYYLDGGEPRGVWWGRGAEELGLVGAIDDEAFLAVMAGQHPATARDLGRRFGDSSVRGFDATFSAPKPLHVVTEDQAIGARLSAGMWAAPNSPQGPTDPIPER